ACARGWRLSTPRWRSARGAGCGGRPTCGGCGTAASGPCWWRRRCTTARCGVETSTGYEGRHSQVADWPAVSPASARSGGGGRTGEQGGAVAVVALEVVDEAVGDVAGQQLGRGVLDGQEHAVAAGEQPFPVAVADADAPLALLHGDVGVARRQHHAVVELVGD